MCLMLSFKISVFVIRLEKERGVEMEERNSQDLKHLWQLGKTSRGLDTENAKQVVCLLCHLNNVYILVHCYAQ